MGRILACWAISMFVRAMGLISDSFATGGGECSMAVATPPLTCRIADIRRVDMAQVTGGELLVRTLAAAGVKTAFGLHGAHLETIFQACAAHDIPIIDTRHE